MDFVMLVRDSATGSHLPKWRRRSCEMREADDMTISGIMT